MPESIEVQRNALNTPVDPRFIHKSPGVKGPYTTGDYVRWKLNQIFGPDNWNHTIVEGPEKITLNEQNAYIQVLIRLTVQFANGQQVIHDDVGVVTLSAKQGAGLGDTAPERYETALKSAITDGLKACAEYLGVCFRPLSDEALAQEVRQPAEKPRDRPRSPSRGPDARPAVDERPSSTDFWLRFNDLQRAGKIDANLKKAEAVEQAKKTGNWAEALEWLETVVK